MQVIGRGVAPLRGAFNGAATRVRLLVLLSPT